MRCFEDDDEDDDGNIMLKMVMYVCNMKNA